LPDRERILGIDADLLCDVVHAMPDVGVQCRVLGQGRKKNANRRTEGVSLQG
jgi:hypothetical protein